jgi:hypothetical protein
MGEALTLAELDARVAEIRRDTAQLLQLVPPEGRYGDWEALARKHREMLPILQWARDRLGALQPPPDRAAAYRHYLEQRDRQLILERAVLSAAEAQDFSGYVFACRILARAIPEIQEAGRQAGLRSARPSIKQRAHIRLTLPWHIIQAKRHARAEHRAGRSWR